MLQKYILVFAMCMTNEYIMICSRNYNIYSEVAGVTRNSPYWKYNKSCDEKCHTKHNEEEVTQPLVLGVVGLLGCL